MSKGISVVSCGRGLAWSMISACHLTGKQNADDPGDREERSGRSNPGGRTKPGQTFTDEQNFWESGGDLNLKGGALVAHHITGLWVWRCEPGRIILGRLRVEVPNSCPVGFGHHPKGHLERLQEGMGGRWRCRRYLRLASGWVPTSSREYRFVEQGASRVTFKLCGRTLKTGDGRRLSHLRKS